MRQPLANPWDCGIRLSYVSESNESLIGQGHLHLLGIANLMTKIASIATCGTFALALMSGCQQSELQKSSSEFAPKSIEPHEDAPPVSNQAADPRIALRKAMANYVAPYPDRQTLFIPPKDAPKSRSGPVGEGDVRLRGLVNVGQPQAILDIEGAIALIGVGHEKFGVKVVSIEHHEVVLQRGPTRWTASLD